LREFAIPRKMPTAQFMLHKRGGAVAPPTPDALGATRRAAIESDRLRKG
jgi:hypothetical protein